MQQLKGFIYYIQFLISLDDYNAKTKSKMYIWFTVV